MPRRILSITLLVVFSLLIVAQLSGSRSYAQLEPVTSSTPTLTPTTSPSLTPTPVTFANLVGKVTYKQLGRLLGNAQRIIPAQNVVVKVRGFFNKNLKFQTTTDANGNYSLNVPEGKYEVRISGGTTGFWIPPFRFVSVKNNAKTANFQGLLFPHF
jgi:hypothetical protein